MPGMLGGKEREAVHTVTLPAPGERHGPPTDPIQALRQARVPAQALSISPSSWQERPYAWRVAEIVVRDKPPQPCGDRLPGAAIRTKYDPDSSRETLDHSCTTSSPCGWRTVSGITERS